MKYTSVLTPEVKRAFRNTNWNRITASAQRIEKLQRRRVASLKVGGKQT